MGTNKRQWVRARGVKRLEVDGTRGVTVGTIVGCTGRNDGRFRGGSSGKRYGARWV